MLKKIFVAILIAALFMIQSTTSAQSYPKYLNGDKNYILFDGYQGDARYLIRNSLNVRDDYPVLTASIDWVIVPDAYNGAINVTAKYHSTFVYNRDTWQLFAVAPNGNKQQLDKNAGRAEGSALVSAAEITFFLASGGEKFFGLFPDDFYPDL